MDYAEISYFDGAHFAHIAVWQERRRLEGIDRRARLAIVRRFARGPGALRRYRS